MIQTTYILSSSEDIRQILSPHEECYNPLIDSRDHLNATRKKRSKWMEQKKL